jgi:hypothetical protein
LIEGNLKHDLAVGGLSPPREEKPAELPGGIPLPQVDADPPNIWETLGVSLAFVAVMLAVACVWFSTRDY